MKQMIEDHQNKLSIFFLPIVVLISALNFSCIVVVIGYLGRKFFQALIQIYSYGIFGQVFCLIFSILVISAFMLVLYYFVYHIFVLISTLTIIPAFGATLNSKKRKYDNFEPFEIEYKEGFSVIICSLQLQALISLLVIFFGIGLVAFPNFLGIGNISLTVILLLFVMAINPFIQPRILRCLFLWK
jgi:hypothetical protein